MRRGAVAAAAVLGLLGAALVATPAQAASPPTGEPLECMRDSFVESCFEVDGDDFWVKDAKADGASALVSWRTDYGRAGQCRNKNGAGTWFECTYDLTEGKIVYWDHFTYDGDTGKTIFTSGTYRAVI